MTENSEINTLKLRIAQLEAENEQLAKLVQEHEHGFQNISVGIHSINAQGIFQRINDTELSWLGYTREEVIGKMHAREVVVVENSDNHIFNSGFKALDNTTKIFEVRRIFRRKNGTTFPVLLRATAIRDEAGKFLQTLSVVIDISRQILMEEQLQQANEELYHVNQEKNRFIGVTSHDLQNPISTISMSAELLNKTGTNLTQVQKRLVHNIHAATKRMSSLIKNVLNINRIERGIIQPEFQLVNVKSCAWDALARLQIFANRKKIKLNFDATNEDWNVTSDPNFLCPVLENVISNAIKFTHEGGNVAITLSKTNTYVSVEIRDDGQGIKEEELPILFGKFQKLSAKPTAGELSNGLGLSIVKEYVMLLRGGIDVYSEWGKGATFVINLPINI
jgi:PAS domain S-box-containing protein